VGNDLQKGTVYATGGVGGQGSITSANLNAHVDDAIIKPTFITAKAARAPGVLTDQILLESSGALYKMLLSTLQTLLSPPDAPTSIYPGTIIQTVSATPYTANANLALIPLDNTIPQITEGTQILTLNITPRSSTSQIRLVFNGFGGVDTGGISLAAAVFRLGNVNALKTVTQMVTSPNYMVILALDWIDSPASTTQQTYSIRAGTSSNIGRMNGNTTGQFFGGSAACTLVAQEIKA
jgi:hypothetical protein